MLTKTRARSGMYLVAVAGAIVVMAGLARADVSTERPGSILILPKIVADGQRDTLIQISNTSNTMAHAHCFYVNGAPQDPSAAAGPANPPLCQETDFFLWLTKQQPTHWYASAGRTVDPTDAFGSDGAGLDPGVIPPVPVGFTGELVCVQVDGGGVPSPGNALIGQATIADVGEATDQSEYNGITIPGNDPDADEVLNLDGDEYGACPESLVFNHIAQGAEDEILGEGSSVSNRLTLVPCANNFEDQIATRVSVEVRSCDEFEDCLSGNINFSCWLDADMDDSVQIPGNPFTTFSSFGPFKYSELTPSPVCVGGTNPGAPCNPDAPVCTGGGSCEGVVGLLGTLEASHTDAAGYTGRGLQNLHKLGESPGGSITIVAQ